MKGFLALALVAVTLPSVAQGVVQSSKRTNTGEMMAFCKQAIRSFDSNSAATIDSAYCFGYMRGMADMNDIADEGGVCIPQGVGTIQLARIFVKWADENPGLHHEDMAIGWVSSMRATFPCPSKRR